MMYTLYARRTFIFAIIVVIALLAALAYMVFLVSHQIHPSHILSAVPGIIYPHS